MTAATASGSARRVLAVGPRPPPINGMSFAFQMLLERLPTRGWDIDVVDVADHAHSSRPRGTFALYRMKDAAQIAAQVARRVRKADVVYLTLTQSRLGFLKDLGILWQAYAWRKPVVVHLHGGNFTGFFLAQPGPYRSVIAQTVRRASKIIVLASSLRGDFDVVGVAADQLAVVGNACEPLPGFARTLRNRSLRLLYLSNLLVEKGYLDLIDAAAELGRRRPDWDIQVDFAGAFSVDTSPFETIEAMQADFEAKATGMPPNVRLRWHGVVGGAEKVERLREADVFVLPTYYANEGQPISVIEAMSMGLPVIATAHRAIPETLPPELHEYLVPPRNSVMLAEQIARVTAEPARYAALSETVLAHARTFTPDVHVEAIDRVLAGALAETGRL